jgi:hypothetical protein
MIMEELKRIEMLDETFTSLRRQMREIDSVGIVLVERFVRGRIGTWSYSDCGIS